MLLKRLQDKNLISPPSFLVYSTQYLVLMGSEAYGVAIDKSDRDVYGFCIPNKDIIFPHLAGEILGFGKQINRFEQFQQHHVEDKETKNMYDLSIYNIVRYFHLVMEGNPNMQDSLWVPQRCTLHITRVGQMVRDSRKMFLSKACYHKFRGYAFSQLHKADTKVPIGKRKETIAEFGTDTKFLYHVIRLLLECEQILETGELNLERDREMLKEIRRGGWTLEQIKDYFTAKERSLEELYNKSTLPWGPDEDKIKDLLLACLEEYFGSLDKTIVRPDSYKKLVQELGSLFEKHKGALQ
jgi:predicted nucleotidyltransferase